MAKLRINGDTSGYVDITVPNVAGNTTMDITAPNFSGSVGINTNSPNAPLEVAATTGGAAWRLGTRSGIYNGGLGGGFNNTNNVYSIYARDRSDTSWNDLWIEANTINLKSGNGALNAISINSSAHISKPYQPCFLASNSTAYNGNTTGFSQYVWNSTTLNVGNHYNTSNGRFTAPIAGKYFFFLNARLDSATAGEYIRVYINKNGTTGWEHPNLHAIFGNNHASDYHTQSVSGIMYLNVGDYVQSGGGRNNGNSNLLFSESTFGGFLLG